jgi:uncharacterized membrane protein
MAPPEARMAAVAGSWSVLWLIALGLEMAASGVAVWLAGRHGPALVAAVLNLLVGLRFVITLCPGRVPLITRYARCDAAGLPDRAEGYTRRLTACWAWLLCLFALTHAASMAGGYSTEAISVLQGGACVALFLGEHVLRSWRFPELGRATPWRTLRAIRSSFGAVHAT